MLTGVQLLHLRFQCQLLLDRLVVGQSSVVVTDLRFEFIDFHV